MNEIIRIHLGRQPFVIAVDAHKQLRNYLDAIKEAVGKSHKEVVEEVELRMAELLTERGITGEKTVLPKDVTYLQEQLGKPGDFRGEDTGAENTGDEPESVTPNAPKRLYRDEENGMIAGVCSGLAAYFNVDTIIVRLTFIVLTLIWGWGILLYIILWIITPVAKTSSERLHMRGKAVTVDSLKELVDRADLPGAAQRANKVAGPLIESAAKVLLQILGLVFMTIATCGLFALAISGVYGVLNRGDIISPAYPVANTDVVALVAGFAVAAIIFLFIALIGVAMWRQKWPVPGWVTAAIIGLFFVAATIGAALAPTVINRVQDHCDTATGGCSWNEDITDN